MLCSELIIVFGSGTQKWCHFLIFGHPIVPCDSATPGLDKTGLGMFGIKNLSWFDSAPMCTMNWAQIKQGFLFWINTK